MKDPRLRNMAQELWKKFKEQEQGRRAPDVSAAGEWWGAGLVETVATSSPPEEIARHRNKLIFRANSLKAALDATLTEIERLGRFLPADSPHLAQPVVDATPRSRAGLQDDLPGAGGSADDDGTGRIT